MFELKITSSTNFYVHLTFFFLFCFVSFNVLGLSEQNTSSTLSKVDVGLILDKNHIVGKVSKTCMTMALEDFYASHNHYTTRIVLHYRDSKADVVEAASAAIDLLKNVQVQAILGPQRSTQVEFVTDIGNKARVPIISQATSPCLSSAENPYFVRAAQNGTSQIGALTALFKAFYWHEVVLIYEDSHYGSGIIPYITDALLQDNIIVKHRSVISVSATDDNILKELYKLMTMQTRVFIVNMLPTLASRFFLNAKQAGMMSKGYAWIITDGLTSLLDSLDPKIISSMQGVLGVKSRISKSNQIEIFEERWRKVFRKENPGIDRFELNVFGLWAYDSVQALAMAVEKAGITKMSFKKSANSRNSTDLAAIGTSEVGPKLLQYIRNIRFKGLSGDFHIIDGELQSSDYVIVNVIGKGERKIGIWSPDHGKSKSIKTSKNYYSASIEDLGAIIWPGESKLVPKGWEIPTNEKRLRVGVPVKSFSEFIKVETDPQTNTVKASGFCVDVFNEILNQQTLSYYVPYDFIPFQRPDGHVAGDVNELVYQIYLGKFDAVVGDVTILANRSNYVDFSLPYTESGVAMVVPVKGDNRKNSWIFTKPYSLDLWLTTGGFFVYIGIVVWILEHRVNKKFRGPKSKHLPMILWFPFSTMVFSQDKVISHLSQFVVTIWVFVVLILTSSYTASLTSMLTVQKLQPTVTDINDLIKNGEYIGVQEGSFVNEFLVRMGFDRSRFRNYRTVDEYHEALTKGSKKGGVGAVVDELPYLRLFLSKYCTKYTMVGPPYKTAGLGFAFPKGSPLVPDISKSILHLMENKMVNIERKWFGDETANCVEQTGNRLTSDGLTFESFKGIFIFAGVSSLCTLIIFIVIFLYENREILLSSEVSFKQKLIALAKNFDQSKESKKDALKKTSLSVDPDAVSDTNIVQRSNSPCSPAISISNHGEDVFTREEGFSGTEPNTPIHESEVVGAEDEERKAKH